MKNFAIMDMLNSQAQLHKVGKDLLLHHKLALLLINLTVQVACVAIVH